MKIVERKIDELVEYENNPRLNDDAVAPVAKSIQEFGFKVPILIDKNNTIVCGHTRLKAAIKLGYEVVPCVVCDDLSEDEVRAFRLVENRTSEFSKWDDDLLKTELENIDFEFNAWNFIDLTALPSAVTSIETPDLKGINYKEKWGLVIDCRDEAEQKQAYEFVTAGGYSARIVSI